MKVVCIVQARVGSTRLPNKVMKSLQGMTLLEHVVRRLQESKKLDEVVIATTTKSEDDQIYNLCTEKGIKVFRGSETDVLNRYYQAAKYYQADIIVRVTSDCPLICPKLIDSNIEIFKKNGYDCVSPRSKDGLVRGLDNEIFSFQVLEKLNETVQSKSEREHVTLHLYNNESIFKVYSPPIEEYYKQNYRLCVDEIEDFQLIEIIYNKLYQGIGIISFTDVVKFLELNPKLLTINKQVVQKSV